jgi:hypothetical protein
MNICVVAVMLAGYPAVTVLCESVALMACHDRGVSSSGGAVSWRTVSVDMIKQHVVRKGWSQMFSCSVDLGSRLVSDWPLHLLRPFGTSPRVL